MTKPNFSDLDSQSVLAGIRSKIEHIKPHAIWWLHKHGEHAMQKILEILGIPEEPGSEQDAIKMFAMLGMFTAFLDYIQGRFDNVQS